MGGLHQQHHAAAPPQAPPGALVGVISALPQAPQAHAAPLAPAAAEVEWNVQAAPKSCSWTGVERCGSTGGMDDETRELVVEMLTRIGMMAEDLSALALRAAGRPDEELAGLVSEIQRMVLAMKVLGEQVAAISFVDYP